MPVLDRSALEDVAGMNLLAAALGAPHPKTGAPAEAPGRFVDRRRPKAGVVPRHGGVQPVPASPNTPNRSFTSLFGVGP